MSTRRGAGDQGSGSRCQDLRPSHRSYINRPLSPVPCPLSPVPCPLPALFLLADRRDDLQDRHHVAFLERADVQVALAGGLDREDRLIGLDLEQLLAALDLDAIGGEPAHDRHLLDRLPELGDEQFFCHDNPSDKFSVLSFEF